MKRWIFALVLLAFAALAFARGVDDVQMASPVSVRLILPNGAPVVAAAALNGNRIAPGYALDIQIIQSSDLIAAKIISGEADLAIIPSNLAAALYNKGVSVRLCGPVIWGLLYVVSSQDLQDIGDLKGESVSMIGRGLTPDITFRHLLAENGLTADRDVSINYVASATELAPMFLSGRSKLSMMPEPMLTAVLSKKPNTNIVVDVQEQWRKAYGTKNGYPQASLVVSEAFADEHPEFLSNFMSAFSKSVESVNADPVAAGNAAAVMSPELNAGIIARAIPRMNLSFRPASDTRSEIEAYFRVLDSFDPGTIGGGLPDDDFYLR